MWLKSTELPNYELERRGDQRERRESEEKQGEQEARERNPCWLPFRRKISCLFMRPMSYLLHKGQSVHLFKVSVFPLSSPPCNKCRGYVIIGPRRITGLADCDDCIKACGTFVSSSAHLQMSSWSETQGDKNDDFVQSRYDARRGKVIKGQRWRRWTRDLLHQSTNHDRRPKIKTWRPFSVIHLLKSWSQASDNWEYQKKDIMVRQFEGV